MKTQIIQLESHDETISVKDKIEWSQTHRVLLLWPRQGKILRNRLDLVVLERHCASLGSQLALVSKNPEVWFHAQKVGIPVFKTRKESQNTPWRRSWRFYQRRRLQKKAAAPREVDVANSRHKESRRPALPLLARLGIFTIGVCAVLAIGALLFPSAEVKLPAQTHWEEHIVEVQASARVDTVLVSGLVPAHKIVTNVEKRATLPSSGMMLIPDTYATGEVVFSNLTTRAITLPKNTIVGTKGEDPARFATNAKVVLPAGLGEEVVVKVTALKPGEESNQDAGMISTINTPLGADVQVTNPEIITGGSDMIIPAPTEQDREALAQAVTKELEAVALDLISDKLSSKDVLLSAAPTLEEIELARYYPPEGQPGDELELTMRIQFSAFFASSGDLQKLGQEIMAASLQKDFIPLAETMTVENLTTPEPQANGGGQWKLRVKWQNEKAWNTSEIAQLLLGEIPSQAEEKLVNEYDLSETPAISLYPAWWPRLPFLPFRVEVEG